MKKLLLALALVAGAASAQTNLQMDGTVSTACSLSVNQNGVLTVSPNSPSILATGNIGGSAGVVGVSYIGTPTVTVTYPTSFTSSPTLTFTPVFTGYLNSSSVGALAVSNGVASHNYTSGNSDILTVNLSVTSGGTAFPLGNYTTIVVVNCS